MNSRERVKRALKFQKPDRAPISHAVLPAAQIKYGEPLTEILTEFREDFGWDYMTDLPLEKFPALYKPGRNRDDFGTVWYVEWAGICGIPVEWPIADLEPLRRVSLAGRLHRRAAVGPPVQRPHVRLRRPLVRPRRVDHLLRAAPAVARHGEP